MLLPLLMNLRMFHPKWTHGKEDVRKAKQSYAKATRKKRKEYAEELARIWSPEQQYPQVVRKIEAMNEAEINAEIAFLMRKKILNDEDEAMLVIMIAANV